MKPNIFLARYRAIAFTILIAAILLSISFSNEIYSGAQILTGAESALTGTISGRVFQDFNENGIYDTNGGTADAPESVDVGVANVTITAYDALGVQRGTAITAANGTFSLTAAGTGPYRVEFTSIPAGFAPSARSTDSVTGGTSTNAGSTVQFLNDGNTPNVNLAINRPQDFCDNNPAICSQFYAVGSLNVPGSIFTVPYSAGSTRTTGGNPVDDFKTPGAVSHATSSQVGTTFGLAYRRSSRTLFAAAFMKKHAKFGPGGTGAIYQLDRSTGAVSEYTNLNTIFGPATAGANPHDTSDYDHDNGQETWNAVGKVAFGGMAINDSETMLYTMNLANRTLYEIPATVTPTSGNIRTSAFPTLMPGCVNASDVRPFSVSFYDGLIWVGAICSGDATDSAADLKAYVYTVDPATLAFSGPVLQTPLNYDRQETDPGYTADWQAWTTSYASVSTGHHIYPQPMLTDIDFDRGNMIISLRDRNGDQTGYYNASDPNLPNDYSRKGITAGDILRACGDPSTGWAMESNGRCGGIGGAPQGTNEGPGGGEYYFQENYHPNGTPHDEVSLGAAHQIPGHNVMVATIFDPAYIPNDDIFDVVGFRWFVNATGAQNRGYQAFGVNDFGKANGLGNVTALCEAAPIEIGNRAWRDLNNNGVQDPGEPGIQDATVRLYQGSALVGTAITDANGEYYFVSSTAADPNNSDNIGQVNGGILFHTDYQVRFDLPGNYTFGGVLTGLLLTTANRTSQLGSDDSSDSDAAVVTNPAGSPPGTFPVISLTTGGPGANDHTFDAGFGTAPTPTPSPSPTPTPIPNSTPCPVITVNPLPLTNATVGIAYSYPISVSPAGGGYTFALTAGFLPNGLTLDAATGVLSGTPASIGVFNFTIQATRTGGCVGSRSFTMIVLPQTALCSQFFDVGIPQLPAGWSSAVTGSLAPWVTTSANPDIAMGNAAFAGSAPNPGRTEMTTPLFVAAPGGAQMTFRNTFNLEKDSIDANGGRDGMVLDISINGGAFQDIVAAGGSFVIGGYNKTISTGFGSPIAGRMAWSGLSGGTEATPQSITTTVNLPVAAYGQLVRLRWVVATDAAVNANGAAGAWVDTIIGVSCTTTAARVELTGTVTTPDGRGLRNATVSITDSSGAVRSVTTGSFGYYRFDDIEAGREYVVSVTSRRYRFSSRAVQVMDTLAEVNFVGMD